MRTTFLTYWWTDPKFANSYTPDDVRLLQRMVARNTTVPHEFVCITDQPEAFADGDGIRAVRIWRTFHVPGTCFVRLMTFHPDAATVLGRRVLQLDIDTVITGSLDAIAARPEPTVLWRNPTRLPWDNPVKPGRSFYNTSVVLHTCGTLPDVWRKFDPFNPTVRDDQWWLSKMLGPDMPYFDGEHDGIYRLARADTPGSGVNGELPSNARIVTFPGSDGKPTKPDVMAANPWISEYMW